MDIAAVDIATPTVPSEVRPQKRRFAEMDDQDGEGPNSDELYDWIEDDEVAAEGLLIDEAPTTADMDPAIPRATARAASETTSVQLADENIKVTQSAVP